TPLRWSIVGEASSSDSAKQAEEELRNVRYALMHVLESQKTCYRFRPLSQKAAGHIGAVGGEWAGLIQPQGTLVKCAKGPFGFGESAKENATAVFLPHYIHERTRAFSSIVPLLASTPVPLQVSIALESCRLSRAQEQAIRSALEVIVDRSLGSELPAHLENTANVWLKALAGCRVTCAVSSSHPISESFLKMLAGEIYHGSVQVCSRPADDAQVDRDGLATALSSHILDLRDCIPSMVPLPPLFPQPESLARHGMRRFFNRERLILPKAGARMGCIRDGHTEQKVRLCGKQRSRHLYVLGATGTGKSTLLYNLIMQDIRRGEGVCLIDPHGDLYRQVSDSIPAQRASDVILLDPCDRERAVGVNLLDCTGPYREMQISFVINEVFALLAKMYDMKQCGGPMFEQYFRGALQLIMADPSTTGTLVDLPAVFEHKGYKDTLLKKCGPSLIADFWKMAENARGEPALANLAPYICCKLNSFVHNAVLRPIIGQARSTIDLREIMDNRRILLVNLSRGALGELDMRLLGMIVLTKLMCAAMSRLNMAASDRKPFMVYVDEFQNFTSDATGSLLSESRKYGLCLTLAHQNLSQLLAGNGPENLVHSVLGNVGSMVLFRLGAPDAQTLSIYTRPSFGPEELQSLPNFHAAARILTPKGPTAPFVFQTYPAARLRVDPIVQRRIQEAHHLYSTDIKTVEANICKHREDIRAMGTGGDEKRTGLAAAKGS
ncbi:MAG: type IV secretion system DNA-binding domain-containing protein, partial [Phycisphaerae bacterium]